ncbi:MAG TPA: CaiB/BaiF CoA-transferase family protein [Myxococcales bacterium]|nr:CaiB/BaiF CoA-transferase family protein [Myxococcales bacterium]
MLPLDTVTVVSLEQAVAAPLCTRHLADHGARVVKIERPGSGDFARGYDETVHGLSSHFVWLNRGKESVTLDLKRAEAREALSKLVARADVLVQNLAPGAAARLGLDFATLAPHNPRLVVADISGYGDTGPYRDKKAYDTLIQAEGGLMSVTGVPETPSRCGISVADIAAGMYAYSGILTALLQRERTGRGTRVEVSMLEALVEWMGYPIYYGRYGGKPPGRTGATHPSIAPYGPHRTGDGKTVVLGLQNEREWAVFCEEVLRRPDLATDRRFTSNSARVANRTELTRIIEESFAGATADEVVARLDSAGIANGRLNTIADVARHPQLAARHRFCDVQTSAGPVAATLPPANLEGVTPSMGAVPALGQHTEAVLLSLGYSAQQIQGLHVTGAI